MPSEPEYPHMPPGLLSLHSHRFSAMGTACILHLYAADQVRAASGFAAATAEIDRIERKYSRYDSDSLLSAINRVGAASGEIEVDDETAALLDYAFACHAKSGGAFDITAGILRKCWDFSSGRLPEAEAVASLLPRIGLDKLGWRRPRLRFDVAGMEIDLGGIGKEYAVDRAASVLREAGIDQGLVDLGGDMAVLGPHPDGEPWRIGLRHPRQADALVTQAAVGCGALATSGDYERCIEIAGRRFGHILDPRTGWPVEGLASVTVLGASCMVAGSAATIAMLKGRAGGAWLRSLDIAHLWVDTDGRQGGALPAVFEAGPTPRR